MSRSTAAQVRVIVEEPTRKRAPNGTPVNLSKKSKRDGLPPRRDPYFLALGEGKALGFRRGPDTWVARYLDRTGAYVFQQLKELMQLPDIAAQSADEFERAKLAAEKWLLVISGGASREVTRGTLRDGLTAYLKNLQLIGREGAARIAECKFNTCIGHFAVIKTNRKRNRADDLILDIDLATAKQEDFLYLRKRLMAGRMNETVNRYMSAVAAGANAAVRELKFVGNPLAWTFADLPEGGSDEGDKAVFLTPRQRARLTAYAVEWIRPYLRATHAAGSRPSELPNATVRDYNAENNTIVLRCMKGRPAKLRARIVQLDPRDAPIFKELVKGRQPDEPLMLNETGRRLRPHQWGKAIRAAVTYANAQVQTPEQIIPIEASAYSFRHSRISELLQIFKIDAITVANQTGTSLAMMKQFYWKFIPSAMLEKFAAVHSLESRDAAPVAEVSSLLSRFAATSNEVDALQSLLAKITQQAA